MADALATAQFEVSAFFSAIARVKTFIQTRYNRAGQAYTVYEDSADPDSGEKKLAVHKAVGTIAGRGLDLPADTRFYIVNTYEAQNRAFHFDPAGKPICWITLGRGAKAGGSGTGISAPSQVTPGFEPATKVTIHEIGHTLHAHAVGVNEFFAPTVNGRWKGCAACAAQVSAYAGNTRKEFVAEVFLGRMVGRHYDLNCMQEYTALNGPTFV